MKIESDFIGSGGGSAREPTRTPDTLRSQDFVEVVLAIGEGEIKGLKQSSPTDLTNFFVGETPAQSLATGEANFNDFRIAVYSGADNDPTIDLYLGGEASSVGVNVRLAQNAAVIRQTLSTQRNAFDRIEVRVYFNQLVKNSDKGTFESTAKLRISYKRASSAMWIDFENKAEITVTGKTTGGAVKDFCFDVPRINEDYDIRVIKLSPDNVGSTEEDLAEITFESYQTVRKGQMSHPKLAKVHIYAKASNQFSSIPDFSGVYQGLLLPVPTNYNPVARTYDETVPWNGTFKRAYTNNNAAILYFLATDPVHGLPKYYPSATVNRYQFYEAMKWCDEMVSDGRGGLQPRFTFNGEIADAYNGLELLRYIAGSFNAIIYDEGNGVIQLRLDRPSEPVFLFAPDNVVDGEFSYTFTDITTRYNDIRARFINPELDWQEDWRYQSIDNSAEVAKNGQIEYPFDAIGCTNAAEAIRRANYRYIAANTEKATVAFSAPRAHLNFGLFETVYVADPKSNWSKGGRIKSVSGGTIHLRDPIYFPDVTSRKMLIQAHDGVREVFIAPPAIGAVYSLLLVSGSLADIPEQAVFAVQDATELGFAKPFKVLSIAEADDPDVAQITALEVNVNKYNDGDSGVLSPPVKYAYVLPGQPKLPFNARASTPTPLVSSDGTLVYRIYVQWEIPVEANTERYEVEFQEVGSGTWQMTSSWDDDAYLSPVKDGAQYLIRIWAVSPIGQRSYKPVVLPAFTVSGKEGTLENVQGLSYSRNPNGIGWDVTFNPPTDLPDYRNTGVKIGSTSNTWGSLADTLYGESPITIPWQVAGTRRIFAKYFDTSGNESQAAATDDLIILPPATPVLVVNRSFGAVEIRFQNCETSQPIREMHIRTGPVGGQYDTATPYTNASGNSQTVTIVPNALEAIRVYVRAIDVAGNGGNVAIEDIPPGADSVAELLDLIKGDIDETWLSPAFLSQLDENVADAVLAEANLRVAADQNLMVNVMGLSSNLGTLSSQVQSLDSAFTDEVAARAVSVSRLISQIGAKAINTDPYISTLSLWGFDGPFINNRTIPPTNVSLGQPIVGYASKYTLRALTTGGTKRLLNYDAVEIDFTKVYRARAKTRGNPGKNNGRFYLSVALYDTNGAGISSSEGSWWATSGAVEVNSATPTEVTRVFGAGTDKTFPTNAKYMAIGVIMTWNGDGRTMSADGWMDAWDVLLEEVTDQQNLRAEIGVVQQTMATADLALAQQIASVSASLTVVKYRAVARGNSSVYGTPAGLYTSQGTQVGEARRSYNLFTFDEDNAVDFYEYYDVYGNGAGAAGRGSTQLAAKLNSLANGKALLLLTFDEPSTNRDLNGLPAAIYRCGGSRSVFMGPTFYNRGAYMLLGVAGIGEAGGVERLAGSTPTNPPDAWIDYDFQMTGGRIIGLNGNASNATVQQEILTRAQQNGYLAAQYALRVAIESNGTRVIGGVAISGTSSETAGPTLDMVFRANKFAFMPPEGSGNLSVYSPMVYYSVPTVVNGVTVAPGLYLKSAFIETITADKIDTRGLSIRDTFGNIIFGAGTALPADYAAPAGQNLLYNGDFSSSTHGWAYGGGFGIGQSDGGVNLSDDWALFPRSVAGNSCFWSRQAGSGGSQNYYYDTAAPVVPVAPNRKYCFSVYTGAHRCVVHVYFMIYDASNNLIGYSDEAGSILSPTASNRDERYGGRFLDGYKRIYCTKLMPVNAAYVQPMLRKWDTYAGQSDSYLFAARCQFEQIPGLSNAPGPWTGSMNDPTSVRSTNRISGSNVSTYIENAAIGSAQIGVLTAGNLTVQAISNTINQGDGKVVVETNRVSVYDGSGALRCRMGLL